MENPLADLSAQFSFVHEVLRKVATSAVLNYFNYFTEIEERFQQRRGALLLLSTLDWALIETWREAGIPLDARHRLSLRQV